MASKLGKALSLLLVVIIIAACVGCREEGVAPAPDEETAAEEELTAEQVVANALVAQPDLGNCRFEVNTTFDVESEIEGEKIEGTMSSSTSYAIDQANEEREKCESESWDIEGLEIEGFEIPAVAKETKTYFVGNNEYKMFAGTGQEPYWQKEELTPEEAARCWEDWDFWEIEDTIDQQLELLQGAEVKLLPDEKVKGIDCYVLELTPGFHHLSQTLSWELPLADLAEEIPNLEDVVKEMSVKQWIAKDTFFLTKAQIQVTLLMTPEAWGMPEEEGEGTWSMEMNVLFYDYDKPVSIQLPAEAESATEQHRLDWPSLE